MHFLRKTEVYARALARPRAAVKVQVEKDKLVVCANEVTAEGNEHPNLIVAKHGTQWSELPERVKVCGPDGKVIKPTKGKKFYVSIETFDPFHAVLEAGPDDDVF